MCTASLSIKSDAKYVTEGCPNKMPRLMRKVKKYHSDSIALSKYEHDLNPKDCGS